MMLLYMSCCGAVLIVLILLFRALLQYRVHRSVWLTLWAVAAVRLLLPVKIAAPTSILNLPIFRVPQMPATPVQLPPTQQVTAPPLPVQPAAAPAFGLAQLALLIWALGMAGLVCYFVISHLRFTRKAASSEEVTSPLPLPKGVVLRTSEHLTEPLTYGVFRPVILLPQALLQDEAECCRILTHELVHIRHRDVLKKLLLCLVCTVHWFNPFVWVMLYVASQDMEMRCDAEAVQKLGAGQKKAYAGTLVAAEERKLGAYLQVGFSFSSTSRRLDAIIKGKANGKLSIISAVLIAALLLTVFSTVGLPAEAQQRELLPVTEPVLAETEPSEPSAVTELPTETAAPETETEPETETVPETETAPIETESKKETSVSQTGASKQTAPAQQRSDVRYIYLTMEVGQHKTVTLWQLEMDFPNTSNHQIADVTAWKPNSLYWTYTIAAYAPGTATLWTSELDGIIREVCIVVTVTAPAPEIPEPTVELTPPINPIYTELYPAETEPEPVPVIPNPIINP